MNTYVGTYSRVLDKRRPRISIANRNLINIVSQINMVIGFCLDKNFKIDTRRLKYLYSVLSRPFFTKNCYRKLNLWFSLFFRFDLIQGLENEVKALQKIRGIRLYG